jgi:4-hydroxy-2-oxoheptanedioate aldolase
MLMPSIKELWREGKPTIGAWVSGANPFSAELMARAGFDWLVVDGEHSPVDIRTMVQMLQAISTTETVPMARVQWNDPVQIKRALDGGAHGVVVPWVNTVAEAEQAVSACRYPPVGTRGFGPYRSWAFKEDPEVMNAEIVCAIQIETIGAVERLDEILQVPGVDATLIGPADLALSMGIPVKGDNPHPDHVAACAEVLAASQRNGVAPGIYTSGAAEAARRVEEGWRFISAANESQLLGEAAARTVKTVRAATPGGG